MPVVVAFIPAIAGYAAATGAILASTAAVISIGAVIAGVAITQRQARKAAAQARDAFNSSLRDRVSMVRNVTEARDIVLGRVRKSGQIVFIGSTGANKEKLAIVIALAGHEIDAVEAVYFNDQKLTLDGTGAVLTEPYRRTKKKSASKGFTVNSSGAGSTTLDHDPIVSTVKVTTRWTGWGNGTAGGQTVAHTLSGRVVSVTGAPASAQVVVSYQHTNGTSYARVRWALGSSTAVADARLMELFPAKWTANHRLRGIAHLIVELDFNDDVFQTGIPNVSATIRGAKVFDPRTSTTAWSENPALLMRHYATSPLGGRLPASAVNDTSIIAAANACDVFKSYVTFFDGGLRVAERGGAVFTAGFVAKSGARPKDALDELAAAMAGKWCFPANRLTVKAGAYTSPVMTLTDDDFADGPITVRPALPREQLANVVTGTFADADDNYRVVDFPRVVASEYVAIDGTELPMELEYAAITTSFRAQHVSVIALRDARQALTLTASFKLKAYPVEVLDNVAITNARYGWVAKPFEVLSRRWTLEGLIELTLKETAPEIFSIGDEFEGRDVAPNTLLPKPWDVSEVVGLQATSDAVALADGTPQSRIRVTWTRHADQAVVENGQIEIAYAQAGEDAPLEDWPSVLAAGSVTQYDIAGLTAGVLYLVKVRAISAIAKSDWTEQLVVVTRFSGALQDLTLIGSTNVSIVGNTVTKSSGVTGYNAHAYSIESYVGGALAECIAPPVGAGSFLGLNADPSSSAGFVGIDYAWHWRADVTCHVYEAGNLLATDIPYTPGDAFAVLYDGAAVFWLQNGVIRHSKSVPAGQRLYLDTSISIVRTSLTGIRFGPTRAVSNIGTLQLQNGAATDVLSTVVNTPLTVSGPATIISLVFVPTVSCRVVITAYFEEQAATAGGAGNSGVDSGFFARLLLTQTIGASQTNFLGAFTAYSINRATHTLTGEFDVIAGASYSASVLHSGQAGASAVTIYSARMKVEIIKR